MLIDRLKDILTLEEQATEMAQAAVLVAITKEDQPRLLLTRRASHLKSHAGEVSFPGGKREPDDTGNVEVALRETFEETGIPPSSVEILGELPFQRSRTSVRVKPIVGLIEPNPVLVPEKGEIARIFWGQMSHFTAKNVVPYQIVYAGTTIYTPSYRVDGEVVWGLTGRILASLLNLVNDAGIDWPYVMNQ